MKRRIDNICKVGAISLLILAACDRSGIAYKDANVPGTGGSDAASDKGESDSGGHPGGGGGSLDGGGSVGGAGGSTVSQDSAADAATDTRVDQTSANEVVDVSGSELADPRDASALDMSTTLDTYDTGSGSGDVAGLDAGFGGATGSGGSAYSGGSGGQSTTCESSVDGSGETPDTGTTDASVTDTGQACSQPGLFSCAGAAQKVALICSSGNWKVRESCSAAQNCDQSSGVCTDIPADCAGHDPYYAYCAGNTRHVCGPDLVSVTSLSCPGTCQAGQCQAAECGDGKVEGSEECDDGNTIPADGCEPDCKRSGVVRLAAGLAHTCALLREGLVRCWGNNDQGQIGLGNTTDLSTQKPYQNGLVQLGAPAVALVAGGEHTCALMQDATVRCWGKNGFGQLGLGHTQPIGDNEIPSADVATVQLGASTIDITAGGDVTCALLDGGALRCWGHNNYGQLGLGHTRDIGGNEIPSAAVAGVPLDDTVRMVGTGGDHTCVVLDSNDTRCWGRNDFGQLGTGNTDQIGDNELPTAVPAVVWTDFPQFGAIQPSVTRTFALCANGYEVRAWGANDDGGLGLRYTGSSPTLSPTQYGSLMFNSSTLGIAVGGYHACAWLQANEFRCWGINDKAQLGLANTDTLGDDESITAVAAINLGLDSTGRATYVTTAAAGGAHTCAVLNSGIVRCWGANGNGQLGLGYVGGPSGIDYVGGTATTIPALLDPVQVFGPNN